MQLHYTAEARSAIQRAQQQATREGRGEVMPAHLLLALLEESADDAAPATAENAVTADATPESETEGNLAGTAAGMLATVGIEPQLLLLAVQSRLRAAPPAPAKRRADSKLKTSVAAQRALNFAATEASRLGFRHVSTEHLLLGIVRTRWDTLPWYFKLLCALQESRVISNQTLFMLWRNVHPLRTVVAAVVAEFKLDLQVLRFHAGNRVIGGEAVPETTEIQRAIDRAQKEARETGAGRIGAEHLWLGLLGELDGTARGAVEAAEIDVAVLEKHLRAALRSDNEIAGIKARFTVEARRAFVTAGRLARTAQGNAITALHLLHALAGATQGAEPGTLERAKHALEGGPASRADATIARALEELGFAPDHLRIRLSARPPVKPPARLAGNDVVTRVTWIVAAELGISFDAVTAETALPHDSRQDRVSFDVFQSCAHEFGISFTPAESKEISTVSELGNMVVEKVLRKNAESRNASAGVAPSKGCMGVFIYSLPFFFWLGAFINARNAGMLVLFAVPVGVQLTSPGTPYGNSLSEGMRMFYYALGIVIIGLVAAVCS